MTSATATLRQSLAPLTHEAAQPSPEALAPTRSSSRAARILEFMLVGGVTLVLFPLSWLVRRWFGADDAELAVGFLCFYGAYVVNDPHFSVTYLLFYKNARERAVGSEYRGIQRVRYVIAGAVVPLVLLLWSAVALATKSAAMLGLMVELMFLLVGWHYVKQGFGVLTVLSARRGVRFSALERKAFLAHCFTGWAYAWASPTTASTEVEEKGVVYTTIAHPALLERVTQGAFAISTFALVLVLVAKWRRERRVPPLAPLIGFVVTVWSWTIFSQIDPLLVYVIPGLHSVQYLYFVWLLKRNEARAQQEPPSFGLPVWQRLALLSVSALGLGWVLFHGAPALLDTALISHGSRAFRPTDALGATPYFAAIFAFVNIHHYFMDNVIWRRDNPETRHLHA